MSKYANLLCENIKESIESYIIENNMKAGDLLPSERKLSELFGANRLTVRAALKFLRNEHIICTEHGKGNFIAPKKIVEDTTYFLSFSKGWAADGYKPSSRLLFFQTVDASLSVGVFNYLWAKKCISWSVSDTSTTCQSRTRPPISPKNTVRNLSSLILQRFPCMPL